MRYLAVVGHNAIRIYPGGKEKKEIRGHHSRHAIYFELFSAPRPKRTLSVATATAAAASAATTTVYVAATFEHRPRKPNDILDKRSLRAKIYPPRGTLVPIEEEGQLVGERVTDLDREILE